MGVIVLGSNCPPDRFYRGGARIRTFRNEPPGGEREPEDWIGSVTTLAGETELGLSRLPDGRTLPAAIDDDPIWWLGRRHVERFGVDTRLLVKLLDAGERLPVHAHPSRAFAWRHLGRAHGKAEAWFIVGGGVVQLGIREAVTQEALRLLVRDQQVDEMLDLLHPIDVEPGDVVYVAPGMLHAIGGGVFLVEVQEPEDLSILLEWNGFAIDGRRDGHLGLGFDLALGAVDRHVVDADELATLVRPAGFGPSVLPPAADPYFRMERRRITGSEELAPGFAIVLIMAGSLSIELDEPLDAAVGTTMVVPHGAGPLNIAGVGEIVACRPPV